MSIQIPDPFERVVFRGKLMDQKTACFLRAMEAELGYELTVVQGCWQSTDGSSNDVGASAGTHDLGGVVDLAAYDWERKVKVGADLGGFPYHRVAIPGLWGEHIHMGIRNHGRLSEGAHVQQLDWDATPPRDGLKYHNELTGQYHPGKPIGFDYEATYRRLAAADAPKPVVTPVTKARDVLVEAIHATGQAAAHLDHTDPTRVKARDQIDDIRKARRALKASLESLPTR